MSPAPDSRDGKCHLTVANLRTMPHRSHEWPATLAHGAVNTAFDFFRFFTVTATPLALEYLAGETGVLTLVATALSAAVILNRLRQRRGAQAVQLPSGA